MASPDATPQRLTVGTALLNDHGYQVVRALGRGEYSEVLLVKNAAGAPFAAKVLQDPELTT